jgi:hypothetical protein
MCGIDDITDDDFVSRLPAVTIGLVIDADEDEDIKERLFNLQEILLESLQNDFPEFGWVIRVMERRDFPNDHPVDPLSLLEFGSDIKIENNFDFLLVFTGLPLKARFGQGISGVPSNILETGVISVARFLEYPDVKRANHAMFALCKHILGHLWGLEHQNGTVMMPREFWRGDGPLQWDENERKKIREYLEDIADPRLEETSVAPTSAWKFYVHVLLREGTAIARDILLFRSWLMVLHLGRFTAATAVSIIFLFLSAEAWEMGAAIRSVWLDMILFLVLIVATLSIYFGQNLQEIGRSDRMMEQAVRSRIVLFGTLLVGMVSFWLNLFLISVGVIYLLP